MSEILIEGKGIAGYNLATKLADNGAGLLLSGAEYNKSRSWFVLSDRLPQDLQSRVRSGEIPSHSLDAFRYILIDPITGDIKQDFTTRTHDRLVNLACVMLDDNKTKALFKDLALSQSSISTTDSSVLTVSEKGHGYEVIFDSGEKETFEKVVDASGSRSKLLRSLKEDPLKDNAIVYWVYGRRVRGKFDPNTMIQAVNGISTGRVSWIAPWSSEVADILAADYCRVSDWKKRLESGEFQETYERFRQMCVDLGVCKIDEELETVYGRTRLVPVDKAYGGNGVFAVGDAAGQADPNFGEGVPPALLNTDFLAEQLNMNPEYTGSDYYRDWRHGRQKIEPYELSAAFLAARYPNFKSGHNAGLYRAIAEFGDLDEMMRIVRERKINISDVPDLTMAVLKDPSLAPKIIAPLIRSRVVFSLPRYKKILYGESLG